MIARHFGVINPTPDLPSANRSHYCQAAAIFSGIISVWGVEVAEVMNPNSVTEVQADTLLSVFLSLDGRVAMAAIRAAGALMAANPAAGTLVVHAKEAGVPERSGDKGALGVFGNPTFALPGASGCFLLPSGRHALFVGQPLVTKT